MDESIDEERPGIVVRNLTKRFGDLLVLDDISFDVGQGELLCIVGPTGCGKTTFMNALAKLIPASEGNILIHDEEADPYRHNIAYVFQESTSLAWRTVRQNVAYGMEIKRVPPPERETRLQRIIELVGLTDCADLYPNQISASMEQRVSVARAFATHPDLLLMDEPYGQLDVKLRFYLEDELVRLWQELKSTVIFVTHNIEEAVYLAERIIILTNKPTKIKSEIKIDLPRPRDFLHPQFIKIRKEVTELIRWW
jgi:sulfonate transport system ATP-binding protein